MKKTLGSFGVLASIAVVAPLVFSCATGEELAANKAGGAGVANAGAGGSSGADASAGGGNGGGGGAQAGAAGQSGSGGDTAGSSGGGAAGAGGTGGVAGAAGSLGGAAGTTGGAAGTTGGAAGTTGGAAGTTGGAAGTTGGAAGTTGGAGGGGTGGATTCTKETDAVFCTRLGKTCGAFAGTDNCGAARSVASCGACTAPQTCTANACAACVPETNPAFCSRLGKNCGSVTANDNCGAPRTVNPCGTCAGTDVCGTTNMCAPSGCNLAPFGGPGDGGTPYAAPVPRAIPGTIQFEDYDLGGELCAYHDKTPTANQGGVYRADGVDLQVVGGGEPAGFDIGWVEVGEWLKYTVAVTGATHDFSFRVSCAADAPPAVQECAGAFHVESETNAALIPAVTIPATANGQTYTTVTVKGVALPAGTHTLKIVIDALPYTVNLNFFSAT
jgi:hypothetical protein